MPRKTLSARLHPIVDAYIHTGETLTAILAKHARGAGDPLLKAMCTLREAINGTASADLAFRAAEAVPRDAPDPDLHMLFLALWTHLSIMNERLEQAGAQVDLMKSLVSGRTRPEIRVAALLSESNLVGARGDERLREMILRKALGILPLRSPRRPYGIWTLVASLAMQGRCAEVPGEIRWLETARKPKYLEGMLRLAKYQDAVEAGRLDVAEALAPAIESDPILAGPSASFGFNHRSARILHDLLRAASGLPGTPPPGVTDAPDCSPYVAEIHRMQERYLDSCRGINRSLLERKPKEALVIAQREIVQSPFFLRDNGFCGYSAVRAELSAGNGAAARRLLQLRRERGSVHSLDDLFLARADLLDGDVEKAARNMALAMDAADRYRARGRLDLELRMSCEMAPSDLLRLSPDGQRPARGLSRRSPRLVQAATGVKQIVGKCAQARSLRNLVLKLAPLEVPVLVIGETGTGKELVARALHEESPRAKRPFVAIHCGAIAETLLEAELFGHVRGAFTGAERNRKGLLEEAADGTAFLDEIGEISPRMQVALLRVLESGEIRPVGSDRMHKIRCRVLAATNADLERLTEEGKFRKDLLYRLLRMEIRIPPLRQRREDILMLAEYFLNLDRPGESARMAPDLRKALQARDWPGNVRELANAIERMRLMHSDKLSYDAADLERPSRASAEEVLRAPGNEGDVGRILEEGRTALRRLDRLRDLFRRHGKLTRAEIARILGVSKLTATRYLKALRREGLVDKVEPTPSPSTHYFLLRKNG